MKNIFLALLLLFESLAIFSQTSSSNVNTSFLGNLVLAVQIGDNSNELDIAQKSKLQAKILTLVTSNGISGVDSKSTFAINTNIHVYDESVVEGLRNLIVVSTELNLIITQPSKGTVFSSYNLNIKGTGFNKFDALNNAISQINANDTKVIQFLDEGKKKIYSYYASKCDIILAESDKYMKLGQYDKSLAILLSFPTEVHPCYNKIKLKTIEVYKKYQSNHCESQLIAAKSYIAGKQFLKALSIISTIDPNSGCYNEAKSLVNVTEAKLDAYSKIQWQNKREELIIEGIRDVFVAWLGGGPSLFELIAEIMAFL